jgi:hypothetical protein
VRKSLFVACALACSMVAVAAQEAAAAQTEAAAAVAVKGKMLVAANGARLGFVDRVNADGSAKIIIEGRVVTIPAATLSNVDGKLTTSLTKNEVIGR